MSIVICRRLEFKWGLHKSRHVYVTLGTLSITLRIMYMHITFDTKEVYTVSKILGVVSWIVSGIIKLTEMHIKALSCSLPHHPPPPPLLLQHLHLGIVPLCAEFMLLLLLLLMLVMIMLGHV